MNISIVFANILGGREFLGDVSGESNFGDEVVDKYIEVFKTYRPDVLSLAEVHLEDDTHSEMVAMIAQKLELPYFDMLGTDNSHVTPGKILATAVLSRHPIINAEHIVINAPDVQIDRPDGQHWVMHNKGAQTISLDLNGKVLQVSNLHYFPFHHFKRKMNEPEFAPHRQSLVTTLTAANNAAVSIITGDFNNKGFPLKEAFPELFEAGFSEAVEVETTIVGGTHQLDHILYKPDQTSVVSSEAFPTPGDHLALHALLTFE